MLFILQFIVLICTLIVFFIALRKNLLQGFYQGNICQQCSLFYLMLFFCFVAVKHYQKEKEKEEEEKEESRRKSEGMPIILR